MAEKRTNSEWLSDLRTEGFEKDDALQDLRAVIVRGLPYALTKWLSSSDPQFYDLVEEVAQETLLRVLSHLYTFKGRSQFTTWVQKIAVRLAITELRRKRWQDTSLDELVDTEGSFFGSRLLVDPAVGPEIANEQSETLRQMRRLITEEMKEKQQKAMIAVRLHGMPIEEAARKMDMTRNALYKLLHDARLRLKKRMEEEGITADDVLAVFE